VNEEYFTGESSCFSHAVILTMHHSGGTRRSEVEWSSCVLRFRGQPGCKAEKLVTQILGQGI